MEKIIQLICEAFASYGSMILFGLFVLFTGIIPLIVMVSKLFVPCVSAVIDNAKSNQGYWSPWEKAAEALVSKEIEQ